MRIRIAIFRGRQDHHLLYRWTICGPKHCFSLKKHASTFKYTHMYYDRTFIWAWTPSTVIINKYDIYSGVLYVYIFSVLKNKPPKDLHIFVVTLSNFSLYRSDAISKKCSVVIGGYQAMHVGTPLCSMRSELRINNSPLMLFCRSYST